MGEQTDTMKHQLELQESQQEHRPPAASIVQPPDLFPKFHSLLTQTPKNAVGEAPELQESRVAVEPYTTDEDGQQSYCTVCCEGTREDQNGSPELVAGEQESRVAAEVVKPYTMDEDG
ncbi:hypothetical protein UY3_15603 [Chelonia mydas]|uniref:Uncharacterized protein n=1 Tax=Chelonia mydas TaxID=8469 RepID=M7AWC2_CHEMY|nr:hypothetical protein UY3_15603 [Chelonia mydas]